MNEYIVVTQDDPKKESAKIFNDLNMFFLVFPIIFSIIPLDNENGSTNSWKIGIPSNGIGRKVAISRLKKIEGITVQESS